MRKGPTSHLPLHDDNDNDRQTDTIEIPLTEILDRIFTITFGPWAPFLWASFDDAMGKAICESHGALDFVYSNFLYMYKPSRCSTVCPP